MIRPFLLCFDQNLRTKYLRARKRRTLDSMKERSKCKSVHSRIGTLFHNTAFICSPYSSTFLHHNFRRQTAALNVTCSVYSFFGGSLVILPMAIVFPSVRSVNRPKNAMQSNVSTGIVRSNSSMQMHLIFTPTKRAPFTT